MLNRTQWYLPRQYPTKVGDYEGKVQVWVHVPPEYIGNRVIRHPQYIQQSARVHYDGTDWDMPDDWVLIEWRGLAENPLGDL
jgi:hypothetical protein